ncbi:hypothetical protein GCM10027176_51060 [Actinoallomurus bryophytorum]|nr:hypothetical protein [Actinoallomurus bryophytorum]
MASASDGVPEPTHQYEHQSDNENNDPDGPQDGDVGYESDDQEDDSENDHGVFLAFKGERSVKQDSGACELSVFEGALDLRLGLFDVAFGLVTAGARVLSQPQCHAGRKYEPQRGLSRELMTAINLWRTCRHGL